jgi:hypothetical protein
MRTLIITIAAIASIVLVAGNINAWNKRTMTCHIEYDTSFNGLYLIKSKVCKGTVLVFVDRTEIARKPLFTEF